MRAIIAKLQKVVHTDSSILLIGETGVGKEIFAEYIHRSSNRNQNTFVKIGLASLPSDLMASELFGYEKGAFTSANGTKKGLFEMADQGSIFLDDIDDVPLDIQAKLLRVLESRELMRVGGTKRIPIDIRLICASKVDLKEMVEAGRFRRDLFYRINVVPVNIPSLRERKNDIPLLTDYFLKKFAIQKKLGISKKANEALINYHWPGNVRELRNVVQRASLFADDEITLDFLPMEIANGSPLEHIIQSCSNCFYDGKLPFRKVINCLEIKLINEALSRSGGNQSEAAKNLGLSLSTLRDKIKKHQLIAEHCENQC